MDARSSGHGVQFLPSGLGYQRSSATAPRRRWRPRACGARQLPVRRRGARRAHPMRGVVHQPASTRRRGTDGRTNLAHPPQSARWLGSRDIATCESALDRAVDSRLSHGADLRRRDRPPPRRHPVSARRSGLSASCGQSRVLNTPAAARCRAAHGLGDRGSRRSAPGIARRDGRPDSRDWVAGRPVRGASVTAPPTSDRAVRSVLAGLRRQSRRRWRSQRRTTPLLEPARPAGFDDRTPRKWAGSRRMAGSRPDCRPRWRPRLTIAGGQTVRGRAARPCIRSRRRSR